MFKRVYQPVLIVGPLVFSLNKTQLDINQVDGALLTRHEQVLVIGDKAHVTHLLLELYGLGHLSLRHIPQLG